MYTALVIRIAIHPEGKGRRPGSVQLNRMLAEHDPDGEVPVGLEVTIANGDRTGFGRRGPER